MFLLLLLAIIIWHIEKIEFGLKLLKKQFKTFVAHTSIWYISKKFQRVLDDQYEREEEWRRNRLPGLQAATRQTGFLGSNVYMASDAAIAERLMHTKHQGREDDERTIMERIYGPLEKEVEL